MADDEGWGVALVRRLHGALEWGQIARSHTHSRGREVASGHGLSVVILHDFCQVVQDFELNRCDSWFVAGIPKVKYGLLAEVVNIHSVKFITTINCSKGNQYSETP